MKTNKRFLAFTMTTLLSLSLLSGCGADANNNSNSGSNGLDFSNSSLSGTVTAVDDNVITLTLAGGMGGRQMMGGGAGGDKPSGNGDGQASSDMPSGENDGQTPPDMPSGENDGQTPPDMPSGDDAANQTDNTEQTADDQKSDTSEETANESTDTNKGDKSSNAQKSGDKQMPDGNNGNSTTFTLTITDESVLQDASLSDIAEGSMLTITFGDNNTITAITIMDTSNMQPNGESQNGNNGSDSAVNTGTGATTITENAEKSDISYMSDSDDENALRVEGSVVYNGTSLTIKKSGSTSDTESSDFYGLNAGFLALNGATATISDSIITTNGQGANGIFAYGTGSKVTVSNTSIITSADNSGGIDVTGGASIEATNLSIETNGNSSAAIRSDRGGGTLNVSNGTYTTNGTGSPAVYCTADITVSDATLNATASEGVVIEGKNSVTLENCEITSNMQGTYQGDENENLHGIMIYQSMSGDAAEGEANFTMNGGSITAQNGDLIYSTNTSSTMNLSNVALTLANDTLLRVSGNDGSRGWGEAGSNGADMRLFATNQTLNGKIIVDEISSLTLTLSENSSLEGNINEAQEGGTVTVNLDADSTWKLTGDSYISTFEGSLDNVDFNGYTLYVNGEAQTK